MKHNLSSILFFLVLTFAFTGSGATCDISDWCLIDDVYHLPGTISTEDPCLVCDPEVDRYSWTYACPMHEPCVSHGDCPDGEVCHEAECRPGCLIDGSFVAPGEDSPSSACSICKPEEDVTGWTLGCPEGHVCIDDECVPGVLPDGVYHFHLKASGKALNLHSGLYNQTDRNGTNATVWRPNGHNPQRFRVERIDGNRSRIYAMSSSNGTDRVLDVFNTASIELQVGNNIHLWRSTVPSDHEWIISVNADGYYRIELAHLPGAVMGTANPNVDGGNVLLQQDTGSNSQLWHAEPVFHDCVTPIEYFAFEGWRVTQEYWGNSSFNSQHRGLDFGGRPCNHPVRSAHAGTVVAARTSGMGTWGHTVVVEVAPGWYQHYSHLNAVHVFPGQVVDRGTQLGVNGGTTHIGVTYACHIHFETYENPSPPDPSRPWRTASGDLVGPSSGLYNPRDFCL